MWAKTVPFDVAYKNVSNKRLELEAQGWLHLLLYHYYSASKIVACNFMEQNFYWDDNIRSNNDGIARLSWFVTVFARASQWILSRVRWPHPTSSHSVTLTFIFNIISFASISLKWPLCLKCLNWNHECILNIFFVLCPGVSITFKGTTQRTQEVKPMSYRHVKKYLKERDNAFDLYLLLLL